MESNYAFSPTMQKWFELEYAAYKNIRQNLKEKATLNNSIVNIKSTMEDLLK